MLWLRHKIILYNLSSWIWGSFILIKSRFPIFSLEPTLLSVPANCWPHHSINNLHQEANQSIILALPNNIDDSSYYFVFECHFSYCSNLNSRPTLSLRYFRKIVRWINDVTWILIQHQFRTGAKIDLFYGQYKRLLMTMKFDCFLIFIVDNQYLLY